MLKDFLSHIVAYILVIFFRVAIEDGVMKFVDAHNLAGQIPNLKARVSQHLDKEGSDQDQTEYLYIGKDMARQRRFWYLSQRQATKALDRMCIGTVSSEPSLLTYTKYEKWWRHRPKFSCVYMFK